MPKWILSDGAADFTKPWLNTPSSPITKTLSDVVSVPVTYSGSEPPAFPARVFKVFKIDRSGSVVSKNVTVLNVTMVRIKENKYQVNISFAPEKDGLFQIFFECGGQTIKGPKIFLEYQALLGIVLLWIWISILLLVLAILLIIIYRKCILGTLYRIGNHFRSSHPNRSSGIEMNLIGNGGQVDSHRSSEDSSDSQDEAPDSHRSRIVPSVAVMGEPDSLRSFEDMLLRIAEELGIRDRIRNYFLSSRPNRSPDSLRSLEDMLLRIAEELGIRDRMRKYFLSSRPNRSPGLLRRFQDSLASEEPDGPPESQPFISGQKENPVDSHRSPEDIPLAVMPETVVIPEPVSSVQDRYQLPSAFEERLERWKEYKEYILNNLDKLCDSIIYDEVELLLRFMYFELRLESCEVSEQSTKSLKVSVFWKAVSFRPDVGYRLRMLMGNRHLNLPGPRISLEEATKSWSDDNYWSPEEIDWADVTQDSWSWVLSHMKEPLEGVASYAVSELSKLPKSEQLIHDLSSRGKLCGRGEILAKHLETMDRARIKKLFQTGKNNFLLCLFSLLLQSTAEPDRHPLS